MLNPVTMSYAIRRIMPNIIAGEIIGVQPMTAPSANIFSLRSKVLRIDMNKLRYKTFLRLNDRKKRQTKADFIKAGYPFVDSIIGSKPFNSKPFIHKWCQENIGENRYIWFGDQFFFENEADKLLFILAGFAA
jgi:hypothetical protein